VGSEMCIRDRVCVVGLFLFSSRTILGGMNPEDDDLLLAIHFSPVQRFG